MAGKDLSRRKRHFWATADELRATISMKSFLLAASLFAGVFVIYWPALHYPFLIYDDEALIPENAVVSRGLTVEGVKWAFTTAMDGNWIPVTWLSHMLDVQVFSMRSGGHHLSSVLLHGINAVLLFLSLRSMTGFFWRPGLVAALFAVHPLRVEAVTWIADRRDVLAAPFFLLSVWMYTLYVRKRRASPYLLAAASFALGLLAKPMLMTLPLVLMLLDLWPLNRVQFTGRAPWRYPFGLLLEKVPFFALAAADGVVAFVLQRSKGSMNSLDQLPVAARVANVPISYVKYLFLTVWPRNLAIPYPHPNMDYSLPWSVLWSSVLLAATVLLVSLQRSRPWLGVGWLWYGIMLLPVSGLTQVGVQAMADRFTYLPLVGIALILAWKAGIVGEKSKALRRTVIGVSCAALLALAFLSRKQLGYWRDSVALFSHSRQATSRNWLANQNLGAALLRAGKPDEAQIYFEEALVHNPYHTGARNNLAIILLRKGRSEEAVAYYRESIAINPKDPATYLALANALASAKRYPEAEGNYREALKLKPDYADAHLNLGILFSNQDRVDESVAEYSAALLLNPGDAKGHINLGNALLKKGNALEAIRHYQDALRYQPDMSEAYYCLGNALSSVGRLSEAETAYRQALRLNPGYARALMNLGVMLGNEGRNLEALELFRETLRYDPNDYLAHFNVANVFSKIGDHDEAVIHYSAALRLNPTFDPARQRLATISGGPR